MWLMVPIVESDTKHKAIPWALKAFQWVYHVQLSRVDPVSCIRPSGNESNEFVMNIESAA